MKISVCIPMYNESAVIANTAKTLWEYMNERFGPDDFEIIFSDDGSRDGCGDIVTKLSLPNVKVTGYSQNKGKGFAVKTAFLESQGDIVMFTDADLAYGTDVIARLVDEFDAAPDADVLIGSRNISDDGYEGYSFLRKIMSKVYIKILCITGGFKLSDSQCGCKAFRQSAVRKIFPRCEVNGFAFDFEAILWSGRLGYSIDELPVSVINHRASKVNVLRDSVRMLRDIIRIKKKVKNTEL